MIRKIGTGLDVADSCTEPDSSSVHFSQYGHIFGVQFYQPKGYEHDKLLDLDLFVLPYSNTKVHPNAGACLEEIE